MPVIFDGLGPVKRVLLIVLVGAWAAPAHGQGQSITIGLSPPAISTEAFSTDVAAPLQKGQTLAANFVIGGGCQSTWTVRAHAFGSGDRAPKFPVIGIVNCSGSAADGFGVFAATTVVKGALRTGEVQHFAGYLVEAKRPVGANESVPTLLFMRKNLYSVISIEQLNQQKDTNKAAVAEPWLTIFDERQTPDDQRLVLETWRKSNDTVANLLAVPGQLQVQ
jgi:hypothetical protein